MITGPLENFKCVLEIIPTLKFCDVECNLKTVLDYHVYAEIANELVGQVNLNLDTLEMIPKTHKSRVQSLVANMTVVSYVEFLLDFNSHTIEPVKYLL